MSGRGMGLKQSPMKGSLITPGFKEGCAQLMCCSSWHCFRLQGSCHSCIWCSEHKSSAQEC